MTQKETIMSALEFAESPFWGDPTAKKAARVWLLVAWLHDMNWHPEADALEKKARALFPSGFTKLEADGKNATRLETAASLLNWLHGWGLQRADWQATAGEALTGELWQMINTPAAC